MGTSTEIADKPLIHFREYQQPVFNDRHSGILALHWSRQIGKSYTLAAWAVDRCLSRPGRLITVLSNSKDNGAELMVKITEIAELYRQACEVVDQSPDTKFENMRMEARLRIGRKISRIKVLAANPRTARGFSGDLILDEFAFHENSEAIWEAAEPILSSNRDFLLRIASTGNGKHNMFYRLVNSGKISVSRVPRTLAYAMGVKIFDPTTRKEITPEQARAASFDKPAYDQNYECLFADENMVLLTHELISAAEMDDVGEICSQDWSPAALERFRKAVGPLYLGVDVGRNRDLTCLVVIEQLGPMKLMRGLLRIENMRLPDQQVRVGAVCAMPQFRRAKFDMTGIGLGLTEYCQDKFGRSRIHGINFSSTVPMTDRIREDGRRGESVRVTESLATGLLQVYEDHSLRHPSDSQLRDALRKPEKITSPGGRVSIAATRTGAGHADEFWAEALAVNASGDASTPFAYAPVNNPKRPSLGRGRKVAV